jgi:hypothetical protein
MIPDDFQNTLLRSLYYKLPIVFNQNIREYLRNDTVFSKK